MVDTKFLDKLLEKRERLGRPQLEDYLKRLIRENIFLKNSIDRIEDGIIILDKNAKVRIINRSAELLLGIASSKVKRKKILQCPVDPALAEVLGKSISGSKETAHSSVHTDFPREQMLEVSVLPVRDIVDDDITGWIISLRDVMRERLSAAKRFQDEKMKALVGMAGILAHELGNPLNSLAIYLQLISKTAEKLPKKYAERIKKPVTISREEVERLDSIVTRFLQAARPIGPRFLEADIRRVLDDTLKLLKPELAQNKVRIRRDYGEDIPPLYIDPVQIRQVFINIIKNAVEAVCRRGIIKIHITAVGGFVKVSFNDNGAGIPEEDLSRVYEPYYSTKREGSGLGLVVVHRIVKSHGGYMEIHSKKGEGTEVAVFLPVSSSGRRLITEGNRIDL